jgi:hypothetical protein
LFTKEFSVSTAPEVGRIIDTSDLPSSTDLVFLYRARPEREKQTFYIERNTPVQEKTKTDA